MANTDTEHPEAETSTWRVYVIVLAVSLAVALFLRSTVVHAYRIPSASMENTLRVGDYLLAERVTFGAKLEFPFFDRPALSFSPLRLPERGDIVIFRSWHNPNTELIKRCVALGGDTVEVADGVLTVNGMHVDSLFARGGAGAEFKTRHGGEPPLSHRHLVERLANFGPHRVAPGNIFAMGDNRDNSDDSRTNGDIPLAAIKGRPLFIYWSVDESPASLNPLRVVRWGRIGRAVR
jgi:signal peptidase I